MDERTRRCRRDSGSGAVRGSGLDRVTEDQSYPIEELAEEALASLPPDLRDRMSNVQIVVEDEPPPGERLLGLYQGVPLTQRGTYYAGALPDKITIYRGPLIRLYAHDSDTLRREVKRVVLHEIAHHFGISDERLIEIDRY
jgi:predicted Zn-dependent protease with MMP-like domain